MESKSSFRDDYSPSKEKGVDSYSRDESNYRAYPADDKSDYRDNIGGNNRRELKGAPEIFRALVVDGTAYLYKSK